MGKLGLKWCWNGDPIKPYLSCCTHSYGMVRTHQLINRLTYHLSPPLIWCGMSGVSPSPCQNQRKTDQHQKWCRKFKTYPINKKYLRGFCTSYLKKLQNQPVLHSISKLSTSFWKIMYASYSKLSKELKNSIKFEVGEAVLELLI